MSHEIKNEAARIKKLSYQKAITKIKDSFKFQQHLMYAQQLRTTSFRNLIFMFRSKLRFTNRP